MKRSVVKATPTGSLEFRGPWQVFSGGSAICPDGISRRLKRIAIIADTYFSIPASVVVRGKYVRGYVTTMESLRSDAGGLVVFHPYDTCPNADIVWPKMPFVHSRKLEYAALFVRAGLSKNYAESEMVRM